MSQISQLSISLTLSLCVHRPSPNHHWLWKLHTGLQATWILCLSTLPPDSGTLISTWHAKITFISKEDFGPLRNSPVLFLRSPGKTLLTLSLVQEWLDMRNATFVVHSLWSSLKFLNGFCLTILSRLRLSLFLVHLFLPHFFFPLNFLWICLDTALCEQPASLAMTFCGFPSLWRVSMTVFWTYVNTAVFPMIV